MRRRKYVHARALVHVRTGGEPSVLGRGDPPQEEGRSPSGIRDSDPLARKRACFSLDHQAWVPVRGDETPTTSCRMQGSRVAATRVAIELHADSDSREVASCAAIRRASMYPSRFWFFQCVLASLCLSVSQVLRALSRGRASTRSCQRIATNSTGLSSVTMVSAGAHPSQSSLPAK